MLRTFMKINFYKTLVICVCLVIATLEASSALGAPTVIDSYSESNVDDYGGVDSSNPEQGQCFTGDGSVLDSVKLYLASTESPVNMMVSRIYASTGSFGTTCVPTGPVLATSDGVDATGMTGSYTLKSFHFTGAQRVTLTNATKYVVTLYYNHPQRIRIGTDGSSPAHGGNFNYYNTSVWTAVSGSDVAFYVYADDTPTPTPIPRTPFASGFSAVGVATISTFTFSDLIPVALVAMGIFLGLRLMDWVGHWFRRKKGL